MTARLCSSWSKGDEATSPLGSDHCACRLFLLANNIPFTNELMPYDKWMEGERVNYRQQGLSPLSHLPLLICDGKYRAEHVSISRYAARKVCSTIQLSTHDELCN